MKTLFFAIALLTSLSSFAQTKKVIECEAGDSMQVIFLESGSTASMRLVDGNTGDETTYKLNRSLQNLKVNDSDTLIGTTSRTGYLPGERSDASLLRMYQKHQNRNFDVTVGLLAVEGMVYDVTKCSKI